MLDDRIKIDEQDPPRVPEKIRRFHVTMADTRLVHRLEQVENCPSHFFGRFAIGR
jgi:hypothetical protein